jgi:hypothetical protein
MRILTVDGRARTRLALLAALGAALALAGAAKIGYAATNGTLTTSISVLNDSNPLILGQPTPGGNIGFHINVSNQSTNTLNHLVFTDTNGANNTIVYLNFTGTGTCSGLGTGTLSCSSTQLHNGDQLDITVLFATDSGAAPGSGLANILDGTYAPQSNNSSNSRTDPTKQFHQETDRTYAGGAGIFLGQSLLLPFDQHGQGKLTVGGVVGQSAAVTMPSSSFFNTAFVGTTLQTKSGNVALPPAGCPATCQQFETDTTIPTASTFAPDPFFDGTNANAYTWTFTIPIPNSFKPTGVWHTDDTGANGFAVPLCSKVPVTSPPGICMTGTPTVDKRSNPHTATYSGIGVVNGHGWGY